MAHRTDSERARQTLRDRRRLARNPGLRRAATRRTAAAKRARLAARNKPVAARRNAASGRRGRAAKAKKAC